MSKTKKSVLSQLKKDPRLDTVTKLYSELHKLELRKDDSDYDAEANEIVEKLGLADLGVLKKAKNPLEEVAQDSGTTEIARLGITEASEWFGQVNQAAADFAESHAAELVSQIDEATRNKLRTILAQGLEAGESRDTILQSIESSAIFSESRAELIADTEIRIANGQGRLEGYRAARDNGVKLKKLWVLGEASCEECIENEAAGPIDLEDDFPGTETEMDPGHPNCDCGTTTVMDEDGDEDHAPEEENDTTSEGVDKE